MKDDFISPETRVFFRAKDAKKHDPGFGKGVVELCERVAETGSLNRAAKEMGMAYSKAWRIVKNSEKNLGVSLFVRQGAQGSCLTKEACALVALYRRIEREIEALADDITQEMLGEFREEGLFLPESFQIEKEASPELVAQVRSLNF